LFKEYKKRLFILGTDITVVQENDTYIAKALDINDQGHLIVRRRNGNVETLLFGEVSIISGAEI